MSQPKPASRRHFTDAARAAAVEARRRKSEKTVPRETPEVYVIRLPGTNLRFGWEIRRFGAIILDQGEGGYATPGDAHSAGLAALSGSVATT